MGIKKKDKSIVKDDVNHNILNIISPSGITYSETEANLDENLGAIYTVSQYPGDVDYGWLAPLCNIEGTSTTIGWEPADPARLLGVYNKKYKELKGTHDTLKEESEKQQNLQAQKNIERLIKNIAIDKEPVGYMNILLHPQALNYEKLENRVKSVRAAASTSGCNIRVVKNKQHRALKVIAPYGLPDETVSNMGQRNIPISTFLGGFPMANSGINDPEGIYLGKVKDNSGRVVILDQWRRFKDRVNSNWTITGVPGIGKSTILKLLTTKMYALGTKFIFFDPEEEYKELARNPLINGDVIDCAGGSDGRINPLQIKPVPRVKKEDLSAGEKMEDYYEFDDSYGVSAMALHIQQLRTFFMLYFGRENFTAGIKAVLEECLIELYNDHNLTWDTDVSILNNKDFPIMEELYYKAKSKMIERTKKDISINFSCNIDIEKLNNPDRSISDEYIKQLKEAKEKLKESLLEKEEVSEHRSNLYEELTILLYSIGIGADRHIWNGHTTIEPKTNFIALDVSKLLETDENVRKAQFFNLQMWAWQQMSMDRKEKVIFGVDEGYLFVDKDFPELMKYMRNISKRDRKYEGGLWFITHSVVDILDPAVKLYGQAIIDNSCYKFLMGCDGKNLEETTRLFNLSDREEAILSSKNRGEGVLIAGSTRVNLQVDVMDEFMEMIGTAGGR